MKRTRRPEPVRVRRRSGRTVRHHGTGADAATGARGAAHLRQKRRCGGLGVPQAGHGAPLTVLSAAGGRTTARGAAALAGLTGCGAVARGVTGAGAGVGTAVLREGGSAVGPPAVSPDPDGAGAARGGAGAGRGAVPAAAPADSAPVSSGSAPVLEAPGSGVVAVPSEEGGAASGVPADGAWGDPVAAGAVLGAGSSGGPPVAAGCSGPSGVRSVRAAAPVSDQPR
ncbi:hypothetical protein [Streptomyces sp. NPDC014623]|uniref:hypothetical protein n=1 Tax=Streptomyces sp. NPDC014623 TaxID=3364875 RepID=UPI003700F612